MSGPSVQFVPDLDLALEMPKIVEQIVCSMQEEAGVESVGKSPLCFKGGTLAKVKHWANMGFLGRQKKIHMMGEKHELVIPGFVEGVDYEEVDIGLRGKRWLVKMKSPSYLDAEGRAMHNCIGDGTANYNAKDDDHEGNYDSMLTDPEIGLYSYREEGGPQIDFTIKEGVMVECEGRNKHRPPCRFEEVMRTIIEALGCEIDPAVASATRLLWQEGLYRNIFNLPDGFVRQGDLPYKYIVRAFATPKQLDVRGKLSFEGCKGEICLREGLSARHLYFSLCKKIPTFGAGMKCGVMELDFLPHAVPQGAEWGRFFIPQPGGLKSKSCQAPIL